jgi:hypothetical protein
MARRRRLAFSSKPSGVIAGYRLHSTHYHSFAYAGTEYSVLWSLKLFSDLFGCSIPWRWFIMGLG